MFSSLDWTGLLDRKFATWGNWQGSTTFAVEIHPETSIRYGSLPTGAYPASRSCVVILHRDLI